MQIEEKSTFLVKKRFDQIFVFGAEFEIRWKKTFLNFLKKVLKSVALTIIVPNYSFVLQNIPITCLNN